jgi:hypothetical protein
MNLHILAMINLKQPDPQLRNIKFQILFHIVQKKVVFIQASIYSLGVSDKSRTNQTCPAKIKASIAQAVCTA